jgi:long-subunit acyl-CoA synthetase (AMP-forming)
MKFGLPRYTLDRFFERVVRDYGARPALASLGETPITYAEFGARVARLREDLAQRGIRKGDRAAKGRSKNVIVGPSGENIYPEVIEEKLKESPFVEEALVHLAGGELVARVYPDYAYIQCLDRGKDEPDIARDIALILEGVRNEVNRRLSPASRLKRIIEQSEPFAKSPTNKIKRDEYLPDTASGGA